jgi:hypothetical protein
MSRPEPIALTISPTVNLISPTVNLPKGRLRIS